MRRELRGAATVALLAAAVAGCTRIEYGLSRIRFFAYLRDAPSFDPYEAPRPAPAGAVAFSSPAGEVPPPIEATEPGLTAFGEGPYGTNPFPVDSAFQALGQKMYDRYCLVCHGEAGLGGTTGTIVQKDPSEQKYPPLASDLTLPVTVDRSDGYLYGMIAVARGGIMPSYGARTTHRERWAIVDYVRRLQAAAGTAGGN